jgi:DNA-binding transcriptional MocR family regulator
MQKRRFTGDDPIYMQVAEGLEKLIGDETLKIGDKLPSVRMLSEEYGISMGTAFQAYYHLEGKGLIEARPKSGYYVRFSLRRMPGLPRISEPEPVASEVSVREMINSVFHSNSSEDLVNFSVAVPPTSLLPAAKLNKSLVHAMRSSRHHGIQYEQVQGNRDLRRQLVRLAFNWGGKFSEEDLVVTAGCVEALVMCLKTVTKPGDTIVVEKPTYFGTLQLAEALGLKVLEIAADPISGIDPGTLEALLLKMPVKACVLVPTFGNPLGNCIPDEKKKEIVRLITRHKVPLIEDDIYGELYFGKHRPKTCKTYDTEGWVLYCSSLSKSLVPGYRIGWTLAGRFTPELINTKVMHTISAPAITQEAVAHFLSIGRYEYHLKKLRKALHTQCLRYIQGILQYFPENTKVSRPQGGLVLWIELDKKLNSYALYKEALKHHISVAPGQLFSAEGQFGNCLRLSYAHPWTEDVEQGLKTLGRLIGKLSGERSGR